MKLESQSSLTMEVLLLLYEGTLRSIPFNVLAAVLLGMEFIYNQVPVKLVGIWFFFICVVGVGRWFYSKLILKKEYFITKPDGSLKLFLFFTCLMGITWGSSYFILLPYLNNTLEGIVLIAFASLSVGAIAALAVYFPAYILYVLPMFLPMMTYNFYLFSFDKVIFALMCVLFIIMIFLTAKVSFRSLHTTFELGREKDILINELTLINLQLEESISEVRIMSITDSLTGLFNRRYFDMIFNNELKRAKRDEYSVNLVLIDIDNFKYINDSFGHPLGDEFLIYVGDLLTQSLRRPNDTVFRLGGDEFAAVLVNMSAVDVVTFCTVIQQLFNKNNQYANVTLSMGIICISSMNAMNTQAIITAADRILYQAKKSGKNKIISKVIV